MHNTAKANISYLFRCIDDKEYIARLIALNGSAVLLGDKPACTVTFIKQKKLLNEFISWKKYKNAILKNSNLKCFELYENNKYILVMIYDHNKLNKILKDENTMLFLESLGYECKTATEDKLLILKNRFIYTFPHEIGIFVGIPLKDVLGFMGLCDLPFSCTAGWRIYGDIEPSIRLFKQFEQCKNNVVDMLNNNIKASDILTMFPSH